MFDFEAKSSDDLALIKQMAEYIKNGEDVPRELVIQYVRLSPVARDMSDAEFDAYVHDHSDAIDHVIESFALKAKVMSPGPASDLIDARTKNLANKVVFPKIIGEIMDTIGTDNNEGIDGLSPAGLRESIEKLMTLFKDNGLSAADVAGVTALSGMMLMTFVQEAHDYLERIANSHENDDMANRSVALLNFKVSMESVMQNAAIIQAVTVGFLMWSEYGHLPEWDEEIKAKAASYGDVYGVADDPAYVRFPDTEPTTEDDTPDTPAVPNFGGMSFGQ